MLKGTFVLVLCLFVLPGVVSADSYWVSLGADNDASEPIFLMKIDEAGKILIPATVVVPRSMVAANGSGELPTALAKGPGNTLILWVGNDNRGVVYRALVDKTTLHLAAFKKVFTGYDFDFLQSSQQSASFLIYEKKSQRVFAQRMDENGLPVLNGSFKPTFVRFIDKASISADGTLTVVDDDTFSKIYANPLDPFKGTITGPYQVADSVNECDIDVTNVLPNGRRIVVYADCDDDLYYMVQVDGATGRKLGTPVKLSDLAIGEVDQEIAIDPMGRFVIFSVDDADTGCTSGTDVPGFLPLNPNTGLPAGAWKPLTSCDLLDSYGGGDIFGIDILKE